MFRHRLCTAALMTLALLGAAPAWAGGPSAPHKIEFKGWFSNPIFTPDGKSLVYAQMTALPYGARTTTTQAVVWNVAQAKETRRVEGPADDSLLGGVAHSRDGKRLAMGLWNTAVRLLDLDTGKEIGRIDGSRGAMHLCFTPDGKTVGWIQNGEIYLADAATAKELRHFGKGKDNPATALACADDGKTVIAGYAQATDVSPANAGKNRTFKHQITYVAWDASSGKELGQVGETATELRKRFDGPPLFGLFVSADGKKVVLAGDRGVIQVCDAATRKKDRELPVPWTMQADDPIRRLAFSGDGAVVAAASARGVVVVWDLATGKELRRVDTGVGVDQVALAPDGKTLAVTYQTPGQVGAVLLVYAL